MPRPCAVNCDHIQTVPKPILGPLLTTLSKDKMEQVRQAILFALDL